MAGKIIASVRRRLLTGLIVVIPLAVTVFALKFLLGTMDGFLNPLIHRATGYHVPGSGIVATLCLLYLVGLLTANVVGRKILQVGEHLLARIPLVKTIYLSSKQLLEAVLYPGRESFKRVVLVEYPRKGIFSVGFIANTCLMALDGGGPIEALAVFVPSTPNPTTGFLIIVRPDEVRPLAIGVEEGMKMVVSGGIIAPETLYSAQAA